MLAAMKIATWNVNSVVARKDRLLRFLEREGPDVLCLQELKCLDDKFPFDEVRALGWHATTFPQKTYNGVAVLSRQAPEDVQRGFADGDADEAARFLSVRFGDLTVMSAYVPNGSVVGSDKYDYKLRWLKRLCAYLARHHTPGDKITLLGDFNVAPEDVDVFDPTVWHEEVLTSTKERAAFREVLGFGLTDLFRRLNPELQAYSWWDYRMLAFPKNRGLRIDHILVTEPVAKLCSACRIDRDERKGDKPSDHAPVIAELDPHLIGEGPA